MSQHARPGREAGIGAAVDDHGRRVPGGPRPAPHADLLVPGPVG
jgi:hypothetical protein